MLDEDIADVKRKVQVSIDSLADKLVELSLEIHSNPETKFEEVGAASLLCSVLRDNGFMVDRTVAAMETAFAATAICGNGARGPKIAFLCEYDALPGIGHACGHNLIACASLGAALALKRSHILVTIVVLGTPAEEGGGGKGKMIAEGVFEDIDAALMFHPSFKDEVGERMMAVQEVSVSFRGKAAHAAARPEEGINALDAVIGVFNSINALRQHMKDDVRVHGIITNGGDGPNIVPEHAACLFYLRAQDQDTLKDLLERFKGIVKGAEHATGAKATIVYLSSYKARRINRPMTEALKRNLQALGRAPKGPTGEKGTVSSDIGDVSQVVPALHPFLSIGDDISYHTREFAEAARSERAHDTMILAAKALAMTAVDLVLDKDLLERVKRAHGQDL